MQPDLRRALSWSPVYRCFDLLVGGPRLRRRYVREYVGPVEGKRVLDIGCGPGDMLRYLPGAEYFGFDGSAEYIEAARRRFGQRGTFRCARVGPDAAADWPAFDVAMANGVLHHLNDTEAAELLALAARALKPGGRFVSFDGCFVAGQSSAARWLLSRDRGRHVRDERGYVALVSRAFPRVRATVRRDLLNIPYTHIILQGET